MMKLNTKLILVTVLTFTSTYLVTSLISSIPRSQAMIFSRAYPERYLNTTLFLATVLTCTSVYLVTSLISSITRSQGIIISRAYTCSPFKCNNSIERYQNRNMRNRFDELFSIPISSSVLLQNEYERQLNQVNELLCRYNIDEDELYLNLPLKFQV